MVREFILIFSKVVSRHNYGNTLPNWSTIACVITHFISVTTFSNLNPFDSVKHTHYVENIGEKGIIQSTEQCRDLAAATSAQITEN